jgi:hypothetical protein
MDKAQELRQHLESMYVRLAEDIAKMNKLFNELPSEIRDEFAYVYSIEFCCRAPKNDLSSVVQCMATGGDPRKLDCFAQA